MTQVKIIKNFEINTLDLEPTASTRRFRIFGDDGAAFKLEITNEDTHYYNFYTGTFSATKASLQEKISGSVYVGKIAFPAISDDDHYNIKLFAEENTVHAEYNEVRFGDGSIDLNSSTGSESLLLEKIIYQYTAINLTLSGFSPNGTVSGTPTDATIATSKYGTKAKTAFTITLDAGAANAYRILRQPLDTDLLSFVQPVIGAAPVQLPGENIYPAVSNTDTVDGAVTSGVKVVMDTNVADKMKVGDRITGNAALNAATVTVAALDPDGDNPKEFSMSEAVALADGLTLSFSNQKNYQWPVNNFAHIIKKGFVVTPGTNVTANTKVADYEDVVTEFENTKEERRIVKNFGPAVSTLGKEPTIVKNEITTQEGNIVFNNQQVLALAGDTIKVGGYGIENALNVNGYEIILSDLAVALTATTTTTTEVSDSGSSADIAIASRIGIINNVSTVSGVGINPAVADPTITAGGGNGNAGDITMSSVQTLENGITLTINNTSRYATITGNIEIVRAGNAAATFRFDTEKFLSNSA